MPKGINSKRDPIAMILESELSEKLPEKYAGGLMAGFQRAMLE